MVLKIDFVQQRQIKKYFQMYFFTTGLNHRKDLYQSVEQAGVPRYQSLMHPLFNAAEAKWHADEGDPGVSEKGWRGHLNWILALFFKLGKEKIWKALGHFDR